MSSSVLKKTFTLCGVKTVQEYSRILIEEYCNNHSKTKKAKLLSRLVKMSYYMDSEPSDSDMIKLEELIEVEDNPELRKAMENLNEFFLL